MNDQQKKAHTEKLSTLAGSNVLPCLGRPTFSFKWYQLPGGNIRVLMFCTVKTVCFN